MPKSIIVLFILYFATLVSAQNMQLLTLDPPANQNYVAVDDDIILTFDQVIDTTTFNDSTVIVRGSHSGRISGVYNGTGNASIFFEPHVNFQAGEVISVTVTTAFKSISGNSLARGYTYSFTVATGPAASTPIIFAQREINGANSLGEDARMMDFDADGDIDLLSSNDGFDEFIYFFENDQTGEFCGTSLGGNFRNIEVYDIDGDGDMDNFGATGAFDTKLSWFENEGTFPFVERVISNEDPWTIAGGDIDSDGDIDVLTPVLLPDRLLWFVNDGSGNFSAPMQITTTFDGSSDSYFYIRDINSDGAMDILCFHRDDFNLVWYENDGNQNFTEHLILNTANRLRLTNADLDDDGDMDIIAVSTDQSPTPDIFWLENDGSETFTRHPIPFTTTRRFFTVSVTDLDGDMDMDILAGGYWFENDGSQNFSEHIISNSLEFNGSYLANGIHHGDVDNDGDMDILTLGTGTFSWQENIIPMAIVATTPDNASADITPGAAISITFDYPINGATLNENTFRVFSDYDGIVAGALSGGGTNTVTFTPSENFRKGDRIEVTVTEGIRSTGGRQLIEAHGISFNVQSEPVLQVDFMPHPVLTFTAIATGMDIADLDGDGDLDLISSSLTEVFWHENDGSGNFTETSLPIAGSAINVFAVDQNEDGYMDIFVNYTSNTRTTIFRNDGSQNFSDTTIFGGLTIGGFTDVNHDGDLDLLYVARTSGIPVWLDYRCGSYVSFGSFSDLSINNWLAEDLDADGDSDFIISDNNGPVLYQQQGDLVFTEITLNDTSTRDLAVADLDGDHDFDLLFIRGSSAIVWHENITTSDSLEFSNSREIAPIGDDPQDLITADLDGDGDPDVIAAGRNSDKVMWFENRLNEVSADFGPEQIALNTTDGPTEVMSGDLDGDGDLDLLVLSENDSLLIWLENTGMPAAIEDEPASNPLTYQLRQNYPNPFNPATTIEFELPAASVVTLEIYDIIGRQIEPPYRASLTPGHHKYTWDGTDAAGQAVTSGVYYYRLTAGDFVQTRKMLLVR